MVSSNTARKQTSQTPEEGCEQQACCSSPSAMCYWCTVSLAAWGLLSFVGIFWRPLHGTSPATILLAAAVGCFANWLKNRTFHCSITAWLFLAGAVVFLLLNVGLIHIEPLFVWLVVAIGTVFSFILEWRYARRSS
jgi:hypothetical protein